jgi:hypothetical protein
MENLMTLQDANPKYLEQCRQALTEAQTKSLAETNNWSHVDKPQVHIDWDILYKEVATLIDSSLPSSSQVQALMARHCSIGARFYPPSKETYIGLALFYNENADMKVYHNSYHPKMVEFLGEAIFFYANRNL